MVAASQMGQFVGQNQGRALLIELSAQPHWQDDLGAVQGAPEQRNVDTIGRAHLGHPPDAEALSDLKR